MWQPTQVVRSVLAGFTVAVLIYIGVNFTHFYWLSAKVTDEFLKGYRVKLHPSLVLVLIDDQSLRALGRFPFDRKVYARFLDRLREANAKVVAFDIAFVEPTPSDKVFAEAIKRFGKVVLGVNLSSEGEHKLEKRFGLPVKFSLPLKAPGVVLPPKTLLEACYEIGFTYPFPDKDGVCRTLPLAVELEQSKFALPSLSLATAIAYLGAPDLKPKFVRWKGRKLKLGNDWDIPVLPPNSPGLVGFPSLSFIKVLESDFNPKLVKGKIVLVGFAASGLADRLTTPSDPLAYGVEIHAATINALLTGHSPTYLPLVVQFAISALLSSFLSAIAFLMPFRRSLIIFALSLCVTYLAIGFWVQRGIIVHPLPMMVSMVLAFAIAVGLKAELQQEAIERMRAYVAKPISDALISNLEQSRLGERCEITVLFSDIRNFTPIASVLTPYEVVTLLESYFSRMSEIVQIFGGIVDKFLGDGMMVLFGVVTNQTDHAQRAVLCAWQMLEELDSVNWEWERVTGSSLRVGIGVNTGVAILGEIGAEWRKEFTALGSTVNLAQRLEELTKEVDASLLIGESTYQQVADLVIAEPIEFANVKGFENPIVAYKVLGLTEKGKRLRHSILAAKA